MSGGDTERLLAIGDRVVALARPGEQVEVVVVHDLDTEVRVHDGAVESFSAAESAGVGIRVVRDHRQGFASAGSLDEDVLVETLADARDNATFATVDEHLGLATPDGVAPVTLELWNEAVPATSADAKIDLALELERATLAADPRMSGLESAEYVDTASAAALVSTTGVRAASRETACYLMTWAMAGDGAETQTGFGWSLGRDPARLEPAAAAEAAAARATRLLGSRKPPGARLRVVLDPWVTAQFLAVVGSTLSGEAVLKRRSLFADRVGESVAAPTVTLVDDPTDPAAFSATATDGEGLATRRNRFIDEGRLCGFAHNAYTARRMGATSTGSAVRGFRSTPGVGCQAVSLVPGARDQAAIVADIDDGLLVVDVAGLHSGVNPVSGDFSTGAEGIRIRGGELAEPVREITIASTIQRMLQDTHEVGGDLEWMPMPAAGVSLVIDDVTMSGT